MFINATGFYVPEGRVDNQHFLELNGLTSEWIEQRTGIRTRSIAAPEENINTMSMEAVRNALPKLPYDISEVDLIISASYSPYDTVGTAAHLAQHEFGITEAKALVLSADKNSAYYNETDPKSGHLWGDAAAAFFLSKERVAANEAEIIEIYTKALGYLPKAPIGVNLRPRDGGIMMPEGKDVFVQACTYMPKNVLYLLEKNGYTLDQLDYFIGHQANMRIMANIAKQLNLPEDRFLHNIEELGNTGSVSSALVYAQNESRFQAGNLVALTVFGGGYSTAACLIKC